MSRLKQDILYLLQDKIPYKGISRRLGCSQSTVSYYANKTGLSTHPSTRRYDWKLIQKDVNSGLTYSECQAKYKFFHQTWQKAIDSGRLEISNLKSGIKNPIEVYLVDNRPETNRVVLKERLLKEGLLEDKCSRCGIIDWNDEPISLQIHHKNGKGKDNRLENLCILCPNCHSQTETFAGRNSRKNITQ